ncbi:hypothetical protein Prum_054300 [Phytohabitans rumicis]|uniref:HTH marR-type domain-containing protein n=2 Tax=Phytohabitans rumicis TaxID=1076125 RepID=A0A6V8L9V5_9ACTN|nr:hypothetical protein Prum_054300 [Phytohabitans rumicis]
MVRGRKASTEAAAVIDGLLGVSRVLVGLTARSLGELDADVTLVQTRALVLLASRGPQRTVDLAVELNVAPSTVTRMCDRLVRKGWWSAIGAATTAARPGWSCPRPAATWSAS